MQDGERRKGRGGLLEGGKEGHKMCCKCVSTLFYRMLSALQVAVVKGSCVAREGYHQGTQHLRALGRQKRRYSDTHPLTVIEQT
jgi:hypothetical protein